MDSNKRQKKTEEDKAIRDLHYYFQSGPRKRKMLKIIHKYHHRKKKS